MKLKYIRYFSNQIDAVMREPVRDKFQSKPEPISSANWYGVVSRTLNRRMWVVRDAIQNTVKSQ